ncbi:MAG: IS3 family transposase [Clostridia bacterium]|nr:IS3 family transposase [Clostridia bacterium]
MNKKYSDKTKEKLIEQYLAGVSVSDLVSKFNVSRTTVYTWIEAHKKNKKFAPVDMKKHKELQHRCERLEKFIKILQEAPFTKAASLDEKIMYIDSQISEEYTVNLLCEALQISKATYYNRKLRGKGGQTENQKRRAELLPIIREIYHESGQIYGAGKIAAIMKDRGHKITERVVASIMHENDMFSMRNCAKTLYLMNQERKENILKQEFKVDHPNTVWVSDVTYYHHNNRAYYICVILDLYSRKVVAHRVSLSNSTQLTKRTFKLAYNSRQPQDNLLFHSDQGANYTSRTFMTYLKQLNVQQSFSRKGTPYDNSVCESFFANMKREELYRRNYQTETEFLNGVHNYIAFYNSERPHSLLRYQTPDKYEEMYYFYNPNRTSVVQTEEKN